MLDLINIQEKLSSVNPSVSTTLFIAVDGHGGSGKSTFATWLANRLQAEIIHTDDFTSWDHPLDWWPNVIKHVFEPVKNGAIVLSYPRSQWWEGHNPQPVVNQPVTKYMILEGVSSLRKEFRDYVGFGIFVDTPKEVCLQRGVERDLKTGKTREEITRMWEQWLEDEDRYMLRDNPKAQANIVIDGTRSFEDQVT